MHEHKCAITIASAFTALTLLVTGCSSVASAEGQNSGFAITANHAINAARSISQFNAFDRGTRTGDQLPPALQTTAEGLGQNIQSRLVANDSGVPIYLTLVDDDLICLQFGVGASREDFTGGTLCNRSAAIKSAPLQLVDSALHRGIVATPKGCTFTARSPHDQQLDQSYGDVAVVQLRPGETELLGTLICNGVIAAQIDAGQK